MADDDALRRDLLSRIEARRASVQAFLRAAIVDPARAPEPFDALAVALARFQAARIPATARLAAVPRRLAGPAGLSD